MSNMKAKIFLIAALLLAVPSFCLADELSDAKAQGLVGETSTGYLAAVQAPSPQIQQLIGRVNAERKAKYESIAKQNGTPVAAVEGLAGKKAMEMTPGGQYVQDGGGWKKK